MFAKSEHLNWGYPHGRCPPTADGTPVRPPGHQAGSPALRRGDVVEHVDIDVAVLVDLGFPRTRNLRCNALDHGLTTSALPGAILVKTVASGSTKRCRGRRPTLRCGPAAIGRASNLGRCAAVGRPPRIEPRPMSRLECVPDKEDARCAGRQLWRLDDFFGDAHRGNFFQTSSATAPPRPPFVSYGVIGRSPRPARRRLPRRASRFGVTAFGDLLGVAG